MAAQAHRALSEGCTDQPSWVPGDHGVWRGAEAPAGWSPQQARLTPRGPWGAGRRLGRRAEELGQAGSVLAWKARGRRASKPAKGVPAWPFQSRGTRDSGEPTVLPPRPGSTKARPPAPATCSCRLLSFSSRMPIWPLVEQTWMPAGAREVQDAGTPMGLWLGRGLLHIPTISF